MKKTIRMVVLSLTLVGLILFTSCSSSKILTTNDYVVQVWISDSTGAKNFEALGVPVGDGTTILTIIDYEDYTPGDGSIEVTTQNNVTFTATIQEIDARTGATLLKLSTGKLPPVTIVDPSTLKSDQQLIIWGMADSNSAPEPTNTIGPETIPNSSALSFGVGLPQSNINGGGNTGTETQGAVVVDKNGKVLGLESIYTNILVGRTGFPGYIPPIISIDSATELLSTNTNTQPWANGPLLFAANVISNNQNLNGNCGGTITNYVSVANAITQVLKELGGPLPITGLPQDFLSYSVANQATESPDGSLLTTVFARPVDLYNSSGEELAQAKWVGIQWNRSSGEPNRVVYGSVAYIVQGSFETTGGISALNNSVQAMVEAEE